MVHPPPYYVFLLDYICTTQNPTRATVEFVLKLWRGICKSTHFHLHGIGIIRNLLTFNATAQLIHALITSRLDFCNSILYTLPNKQIESL